eukprot:7821985-Prorocentrum_lima.AAC.1
MGQAPDAGQSYLCPGKGWGSTTTRAATLPLVDIAATTGWLQDTPRGGHGCRPHGHRNVDDVLREHRGARR